jgi:hypothetical protein
MGPDGMEKWCNSEAARKGGYVSSKQWKRKRKYWCYMIGYFGEQRIAVVANRKRAPQRSGISKNYQFYTERRNEKLMFYVPVF